MGMQLVLQKEAVIQKGPKGLTKCLHKAFHFRKSSNTFDPAFMAMINYARGACASELSTYTHTQNKPDSILLFLLLSSSFPSSFPALLCGRQNTLA